MLVGYFLVVMNPTEHVIIAVAFPIVVVMDIMVIECKDQVISSSSSSRKSITVITPLLIVELVTPINSEHPNATSLDRFMVFPDFS